MLDGTSGRLQGKVAEHILHCLPLGNNKSSSLAYVVSIKGNLCRMLGKLSECFCVGGFAVVLIVKK